MAAEVDTRLALVDRLSAAFGAEAAARDPRAAIPWPQLPDVRSMVVHVGGIHRWVTQILRTGAAARQEPPQAPDDPAEWYEEGRATLLATLATTPADSPCWIIGDRVGTAAFWPRRMVFEHAKHLMDVRASGGGRWEAAPELTPGDYADGIDELVAVFLRRSRPTLRPLPHPVVLRGEDTGRSWRISEDWTVASPSTDPLTGGEAEIAATTADLALALWERADPPSEPARFRIAGSRATAEALTATPIHPW